MAVTQHGEELLYGISDNPKQTITVAGVTIYPTSIRVSKDGDIKEYRSPAGTIISLVIPETFDSLSVEGLVAKESKNAIQGVKKGEAVTFSGISVPVNTSGTVRVETFECTWSNEDAAKVSCTLKQYPDISE